MSEAVQAELERQFPFLAGAVKVQRQRRMWVEVDRGRFREVFDFAAGSLGFSMLSTISGLDLGADLGFIYHLARDGGLVLSLKTRCPKGEAMKTVTERFPGAAIYERELVDLLGARIEGIPAGPRYPLPDDWPSDEHPLLKDWKPKAPAAAEQGAGGERQG